MQGKIHKYATMFTRHSLLVCPKPLQYLPVSASHQNTRRDKQVFRALLTGSLNRRMEFHGWNQWHLVVGDANGVTLVPQTKHQDGTARLKFK